MPRLSRYKPAPAHALIPRRCFVQRALALIASSSPPPTCAQALSGSQLTWTKRHEEYQEANEAMLEEVLGAAAVDPTVVLQALIATPQPSAGATPLPPHLLAPLRAFVDYMAFEQMMKEGLPSV